jgi:hypothetical protein
MGQRNIRRLLITGAMVIVRWRRLVLPVISRITSISLLGPKYTRLKSVI